MDGSRGNFELLWDEQMVSQSGGSKQGQDRVEVEVSLRFKKVLNRGVPTLSGPSQVSPMAG